MNILELAKIILIQIFSKIHNLGSARPEVRGTAEPHGGAYPP